MTRTQSIEMLLPIRSRTAESLWSVVATAFEWIVFSRQGEENR